MSKDYVLFMVTLREFGTVGESSVGLELTLDPRLKSSNVDIVIQEDIRESFRKQQNQLAYISLSRPCSDTLLVLSNMRSLGWALTTSNAFVVHNDEFHRIFYFEQRLQLDDATGKKVAGSGVPSTPTVAAPSLDSAMDQKKQQVPKTKPMSVFKQLAAKRMSGGFTPNRDTSTSAPSTPASTKPFTSSTTSSATASNKSTSRSTSNTITTTTTTPTATDDEKVKIAISSNAKVTENDDNDEEEEDGDSFDVPKQAIQKRSSIKMLFGEANVDSSSLSTPTSDNVPKTEAPPVVKPLVPPVKNSFSLPKKESQVEGGSGPLGGGIGGGGGPPVTGTNRKKPGRLSILQLSVGNDFNPAMLAGAKPGGPIPLGGKQTTASTPTSSTPSKRIHNEDEDGTKTLSSHTLTRAPSFRKKQPSQRKTSNPAELREKLLTTIDKMPESTKDSVGRKSPPPPENNNPTPPAPKAPSRPSTTTTTTPPRPLGGSTAPPPRGPPPKRSSVNPPPPVVVKPPAPPSVPTPPAPKSPAQPPPPPVKPSDIADIPAHRGSGISPSSRPPPPPTLQHRRSSTSIVEKSPPPPPPPPPPKRTSINGTGPPPPPPPSIKPSDIAPIPTFKSSDPSSPTVKPPPPAPLTKKRSSIAVVPSGTPPPPPPKKNSDATTEVQDSAKKAADKAAAEELTVAEEKRKATKAKNDEYFQNLRKEGERKKEDEKSVVYSVKELEEQEAAKQHESKKTDHYSKLGASFTKSNTLLRGGGSGRGRISMKKSLPSDI